MCAGSTACKLENVVGIVIVIVNCVVTVIAAIMMTQMVLVMVPL